MLWWIPYNHLHICCYIFVLNILRRRCLLQVINVVQRRGHDVVPPMVVVERPGLKRYFSFICCLINRSITYLLGHWISHIRMWGIWSISYYTVNWDETLTKFEIDPVGLGVSGEKEASGGGGSMTRPTFWRWSSVLLFSSFVFPMSQWTSIINIINQKNVFFQEGYITRWHVKEKTKHLVEGAHFLRPSVVMIWKYTFPFFMKEEYLVDLNTNGRSYRYIWS